MLELIGLGAVNFLYILLRAMQSRSIAFGRYPMIVLIGSLLGMFEVIYITTLAGRGSTLEIIATITISGVLGSLAAVWVTRAYRMEK